MAAKQDLYTGYVDLEKAFDSVPRKLIYRVLDMLGVPQGVIDMVKELYRDQRVTCKAEGALSGQEKATSRGVKQGCPLSPLLFNLCLEFLLRQMDLGEGTTVYGGAKAAENALSGEKTPVEDRVSYKLRDLLFADDIALANETRLGLETALQNLTDTFARYGLKVSIGKTKWQALVRKVRKVEEIKINGEPIERLAEFTYLGSVFNETGTPESDITRRIKLANDAMRRVRKIIWNKQTPRGLKRKILMTFIYPTLTYACETWAIAKSGSGFRALKTWWHKQLRKFCGVTKEDRNRMEVIFKKTGAQSIYDLVRERRLRYVGHVMRFGQERFTKQIIGAVAKESSNRTNLGWAAVMASELDHFDIKVDEFKDKDSYRAKINGIFRKKSSNKPDTGDQAGETGNSQQQS